MINSFLVIFCFLADILQLFAQWAKRAELEGEGRGGAEKIARAEGPQAIFGAPERPEPSSEASVVNEAKTSQNTMSKKQNTHQQTNLLIQRKHRYAYDMTFLCPTLNTKLYQIWNKINF